MATAYEHAWRLRALRLPWDFLTKNALTKQNDSAATTVLYRALGKLPQDYWNNPRRYGAACINICYFCKREGDSFSPTCTACSDIFSLLPPLEQADYLWHLYPNALLLATHQWTTTNETPSLPDSLKSQEIPLTRLEKLKLSLNLPVTKPTGD